MPGLFIERHARAVSTFVKVAVLYVHPDERLNNTKVEVEHFQDDQLLQLKIYFRPTRIRQPLLKNTINLYRFVVCNFRGLKTIRKEFGKPDIIHVNVLTRLGVIALICKWIWGIPYVITEHWTRYLSLRDNYKGFLRKVMTKLAVRNASAIMPVSENLKRAMESRGLKNRNWQVIPNVVDMDTFQIRERVAGKNSKSFIHVSCFEDRQKNISGMLRVLKRLSEVRSDWVCQMVGEGIHYEQLIAYAKDLGIEGKFVIFHGLKENEELSKLMAQADFNVMFSRYENLPVVILESFACGVPVLSTDVGGISEHMNDELGLLFRNEDEDGLFDKLIFMLDHYEKYNKSKIREYAEAHFSKEVIGARLYEIYNSVD
jgi:glycosyltransferase involved in cell wall biosynthesis